MAPLLGLPALAGAAFSTDGGLMTLTQSAPTETTPVRAGNRFGYVVAIVLNAALLVAVNNVLAWGVLPFLTDDFQMVVPLMTLSLLIAIGVNLVYLSYDPSWLRSLGQIGTSAIALAVTLRLNAVFPFDFSGYGFDWEPVVRTLLILAILGTAISIIVELVKLTKEATRRETFS